MSFLNSYLSYDASIKNLLERNSSEMTKAECESSTQEIFRYIDLTYTQIAKDQEEIKSLSEETDELLNQLEQKVN